MNVRLTKRSISRHHRPAPAGAVTAVIAAHLAVDGSMGLLAVFLPDLQARLDLSSTALAGFVALLAVTSSVTQPVLGHVADRVGVRHAAALGTVLAASMLLLPTTPDAVMAAAAVALGGLGAATFHPAATTLVGRAARQSEMRVGLFSAGGMLGIALVPVAVLIVTRAWGAVAAAVLVVPATGLAAWLWRTNGTVPQGTRATATPGQDGSDRAWRELTRGPLLALVVAAALSHAAWSTYVGVTPLLIADHVGAVDTPWVATTLAIYNAAAAFAGVVAGWFAIRVGRPRVVGVTLLAAIPALLASLVVAPASLGALVAAAVAGAGLHASLPILAVAAQEVVPRRPSAAAGMILGLAVGGGGILYLPIGWFQSQVGIAAAAGAGYLLVAPAALLAVRTLRRLPRQAAARTSPAALLGACGCGCALPAGKADAGVDGPNEADLSGASTSSEAKGSAWSARRPLASPSSRT